jgi:hypothetical protein
LKLKYDEPLSKFAFKLNLRRYTEGRGTAAASEPPFEEPGGAVQVDTIKTRVESASGFSA